MNIMPQITLNNRSNSISQMNLSKNQQHASVFVPHLLVKYVSDASEDLYLIRPEAVPRF